MASWRKRTLGDLLEIKHGFAFKGEFFTDEGEYVLLTPGNFLETGGLKLKGEKEKFYRGEFPNEFLLRRGDMLVAMTDLMQDAPILGSPAFIPEDNRFLHNQRLGKVINLQADEVALEFLFYLLNTASVRGQIKGSASGATVRHTSPSRIYEVSVELPPIPVQRRIAGILSAYDELMENSQRRIRILEVMARALYREWFVHFRFPGHEKLPRVASPLGDIPQGWEVKPLDEIATITMGLSPKGDTYNEQGDGTPLINGPVEFGERFTKQMKWTTAPTKFCKEGDLVVCVRGSTTDKYVKSDGDYCLGRGVCGLSSEYQCFVDLLFANELPTLLGKTGGSTFPSWTGPQLKSCPSGKLA